MAGIYIHIPFCKQACNYCNFFFLTSLRRQPEFMQAILRETELVATEAYLSDRRINTIYFGGGTPSLLHPSDIAQILKKIDSFFEVDADAEITLETNPDDIDAKKIQDWKLMGINRISMGVQSFFEEDLQWMHRAHNATQSTAALESVLTMFNNITIDLIYGVPGMTDERWRTNVQRALDYGVPHLSCYALTVEPGTPLAKQIRQKNKQEVDDGQQSRQFLLLMDWLNAAGYEHYEISNFAIPGHRSKHNEAYWKGVPYIGLGPAAHSFDGCNRRWNVANLHQYIDAIRQNKIPYEEELLTDVQRFNEMIMTGIRTADGLDINLFDYNSKEQILAKATRFIEAHRMVLQGDKLILTDEGKLYADGIAADLFL